MKTHSFIQIVLPALIFIVFFISSCSLLYLTNSVNVPMLANKGDFSGNVSAELYLFNLQAAYSPFEHIGLMANYAGGKSTSSDDSNEVSNSTTNNYTYNFYEVGVGYYRPVNKSILYDLYGGFGLGKIHNYGEVFNPESTYSGNYSRVFLQSSVTLSAGKLFDANFAIRPVVVFMKRNSNNEVHKSSTLFFEPVITLKYGWKYVKIINQLGFSLTNNRIDYLYSPLFLSIGLSYQFKSDWNKKHENH